MDKKTIVTNIRINSGEIGAANSFQPQASASILSRTYQPQGSAQVPTVIPHLVSGVATPPAQPAAQVPATSTSGQK